MGYITELKAEVYRRNGVLIGSTTNVIEAGMNDALDIIGDGWAKVPMADSFAVSLFSSGSNRVCILSAKTSLISATVIIGQFIIQDVDKPRTVTDSSVLTASGPSLLHELTNETFGFNVLSDGSNGPAPNPILDLFSIYEVNSPISFNYHSMGSSGSSKAYLVGSGESIFDALLQVVKTNKGHISLVNGRTTTFSYPYYGVQFWWDSTGLNGGTPLWFDELKPDNTLPSAQLPNPIIGIIPKDEVRDIITRVYVYGAGLGDGRFTIADKTDSDPINFTSVPGTSLIINDDLENVIDQPQITRTVQVGNIKPEDETNTTSVASAANALFAAGLQYLQDNDGRKATNYAIKTHIWLNHTCGQEVSLRYVDTYLNITEDLILVEYNVHATKDGVLIADLLLSPSPTKKMTGARMTASKLKSLETTMNHATADVSGSSPPTAGGNYLKATGGAPSLAGNLAVNAGVTVDGVDLSVLKISEFITFVNSTQTVRGRALLVGDGLNLLDGGIGANVTLQMVLKAISGMAVDGTGLGINLKSSSGLDIDGTGLGILLKTIAGMNLDTNGLSVLLKTISGLTLDASGLSLLLKAISGLNVDGTGLSIDLKSSSGLDIDGTGLSIDLKSSSGLDIDGTGLSIAPPAQLSATSNNNVAAASHSHAITASNAPGAAEYLLKSTSAGGLTLEELTVNTEATLTKMSAAQVSSHLIPELTDTYDLGSSTKLWRKAWISELEAVLFAQNTASIIGGWFIIPKASGTLAADVDGVQTTIDFGQTMTLNDFIVLRTSGAVEYLQVGSLVSGTTYNVTRNVDGSGANTWPSGMVYMVLGNTGNGRIELNAQSTPRISILEQGATYNAQTELVRLGDLNGNWGYASPADGLALGEYAANKGNLTWDPTNGLRLRTYSNTVLQLNNAGNASIEGLLDIGVNGGIQAGAGDVVIDRDGITILADGVGNVNTLKWVDDLGATMGLIYGNNGDTLIIKAGDPSSFPSADAEIRIEPNTITMLADEFQIFTDTANYKGFNITQGWLNVGPPAGAGINGLPADGELYVGSNARINGDLNLGKGLTVGNSTANPNDDAIYFYEGSTRLGDIKAQGGWLRINQDTSKNIYSPRMIRADQGFTAGAISNVPSGGSIGYKGNLRPYRNSTYYTAYAYVPISPSSSGSWNGDAKNASTIYTINLSEFSSVPNNAQAVNIIVTVNRSSSGYLRVGSSSSAPEEVHIEEGSGWKRMNGVTRCVSGKFYFQSAAAVTQVWLTISGYWI